jgi:hypothetical protein
MIIDAYRHIFPQALVDAVLEVNPSSEIADLLAQTPHMYNVGLRLAYLDTQQIDQQLVTLAYPHILEEGFSGVYRTVCSIGAFPGMSPLAMNTKEGVRCAPPPSIYAKYVRRACTQAYVQKQAAKEGFSSSGQRLRV